MELRVQSEYGGYVVNRLFRVSCLLVVIGMLMVSGCSKDTSTTSEPGGANGGDTGTTGVQSDDTGELVYATETMGSDDFYFLGGLPPAWIQLTNDRLIRYSNDNEPEGFYPMLAESYEFAPDYSSLDYICARVCNGRVDTESLRQTMSSTLWISRQMKAVVLGSLGGGPLRIRVGSSVTSRWSIHTMFGLTSPRHHILSG